MVAGQGGDGGVVVLEKEKEMVVCMVVFWSCGGINKDGEGRR